MLKTHKIYTFAEFSLNATKRTLFQNDKEIRGKGREFDVLLFLVQSSPCVCSIDEIIEASWDETHVSNNSVEKTITGLRCILGDDPKNPRFIRTNRGKGYSFICDVREIEEEMRTGSNEKVVRSKSKFRSFVPYLIVAIILISWLSMWRGRELIARSAAKPIFEDDFSGAEIDPDRWTIKGKTVKIENGIAKLVVEETDNWGRIESSFFSFDRDKPVTVKSRMKVMYSQSLKDKVYFRGYFGFIIKDSHFQEDAAFNTFFGVKYSNYDYESKFPDGNTKEQKSEGFFLVKAAGDPSTRLDYETGKVSPRIKPVWDEWFEQKIVYSPFNGNIKYFINDELKQEFNVGKFSTDLQENQLRLEINPQGWWLYHSIEIDYISVTQ